jgi:hypothetical protein
VITQLDGKVPCTSCAARALAIVDSRMTRIAARPVERRLVSVLAITMLSSSEEYASSAYPRIELSA